MPKHEQEIEDAFEPALAEEAYRLRRKGASWGSIADTLGYADSRTVATAVKQHMDRLSRTIPQDTRRDILSQELDRLDDVAYAMWQIVNDSSEETKNVIAAAKTLVGITGQRSRLLGLEKDDSASTRTQVLVIAGDQEEYIKGLQAAQEHKEIER